MPPRPGRCIARRFGALLPQLLLGLGLAAGAGPAAIAAPDGCSAAASAACYLSFEPAGAAGRLNYYASSPPGAETAAPTAALIAVHGHSRDANKTFDAALLALQRAGRTAQTLVIAPVFQVAPERSRRCRTPGVPAAQGDDLLWTCGSWMAGAAARNGQHPGSFAVLDALVAEVAQRWPSLRVITLAGFSAGAQMVQRYVGFAAPAPHGVALRYVVADPSSWLYFDPLRPEPVSAADCPAFNRWKYGTDDLPALLGASAAQARARYAEADIHYLEGALDDNPARGTAYRVLDRTCAAQAQGPYRLQRGLAYAAYDRTWLAPARPRRVVIVPGCAHDVACVFPSEAARMALLGRP